MKESCGMIQKGMGGIVRSKKERQVLPRNGKGKFVGKKEGI
jgi:hypothetical protein